MHGAKVNNRDYGVWLIPVLAALALYVPFTTGTKPQPVISSPLSPETTAAGGQQGREIASAGLLPEFLGTNDLATTISQSQKTSITFVIATVPDPRDSSLGYIYDRHLAAIQLASQRADYVLDRFDLPWNDKEDKTIQQGKTIEKYKLDRLGVRKLPEENDQKTQRQPLPRHQREAGLILFRQPFGEETHKKILLLFLVGETPTSGIHKSALIDALKQIHWLCTTLDRQQNPECQSLPVLAPTFSGSIDSIITALEKWRGDSPEWPKRFNMISGSATAINKKKETA